jgi:DNA-binding response OmpR family regulator
MLQKPESIEKGGKTLIATTPQSRTQWLVEHLGKGADSRSRLMAVLPTREDRAALQRIIGPCRWELQWTRTCEEAIDAFGRTSPPIVICDRHLPDGDWRQLWDLLARELKPPMFIVTSKLADDALWAEVLNLGGYDLLLKPFRAEEVIRMVHAAAREPLPTGPNLHACGRNADESNRVSEIVCRAV